MTLLKDLKVGDIVFVEENKVPAKYILVNKHVEYTTECGTIEYRSTLLRVELFIGFFFSWISTIIRIGKWYMD